MREKPYAKWIKALSDSWDSDVEVCLLEQNERALPILKVALEEYKAVEKRDYYMRMLVFYAITGYLWFYVLKGAVIILWLMVGALASMGVDPFREFFAGLLKRPYITKQYLSHVASVATQAEGEGKLELLLDIWRLYEKELPPEIQRKMLSALNLCFQTRDQDRYDALALENRKTVRALLRASCKKTLRMDDRETRSHPLFPQYSDLAYTLLAMYQHIIDVEIIHDLEALSTIRVAMEGMPLKLEINKTELFVLEILRAQAPNRDLLRPATLKSEERLELLRASHHHAEDPAELLVRPSQNTNENDL